MYFYFLENRFLLCIWEICNKSYHSYVAYDVYLDILNKKRIQM